MVNLKTMFLVTILPILNSVFSCSFDSIYKVCRNVDSFKCQQMYVNIMQIYIINIFSILQFYGAVADCIDTMPLLVIVFKF